MAQWLSENELLGLFLITFANIFSQGLETHFHPDSYRDHIFKFSN